MPTSSNAIRDIILAKMVSFPKIDQTKQEVIDIVTCIADIYSELQNLDDNTGTPPSTGHQ